MDYNTKRPNMILREYGRNIQYMVEHLQTIKDDERRNIAAHAMIDLMGQLNPHLKVEEFRPKLWDHLFRMSTIKLEVDSPYELKEINEDNYNANRPPYPNEMIKMKQYGKNVENLINKALEIETPEKRQAFARVIGNYMKMVSASSYKENVNNQTIREDLRVLSKGQLSIDESSNLDRLTQSNSHKTKSPNSISNNNKPNKNFNTATPSVKKRKPIGSGNGNGGNSNNSNQQRPKKANGNKIASSSGNGNGNNYNQQRKK